MIYSHHFTSIITFYGDHDHFLKGEYFMVCIYRISGFINNNFPVRNKKNYSLECRLYRGAIAPFCSPFTTAFHRPVDLFLGRISVEIVRSRSTTRNRPYAEGARRVFGNPKLLVLAFLKHILVLLNVPPCSTTKRLKWHDQKKQ